VIRCKYEHGQTVYTYIVRCGDGTPVYRLRADIRARIALHNSGRGAKYTRGRPPVALQYAETFPTRSRAQAREAQIKQLSRQQKLLLIENWDGML
jgi:putative endonuclease